MRSQMMILAFFAVVAFAAPSPIENEIVARGCPGGDGGNACPEGFFQVTICFRAKLERLSG